MQLNTLIMIMSGFFPNHAWYGMMRGGSTAVDAVPHPCDMT